MNSLSTPLTHGGISKVLLVIGACIVATLLILPSEAHAALECENIPLQNVSTTNGWNYEAEITKQAQSEIVCDGTNCRRSYDPFAQPNTPFTVLGSGFAENNQPVNPPGQGYHNGEPYSFTSTGECSAVCASFPDADYCSGSVISSFNVPICYAYELKPGVSKASIQFVPSGISRTSESTYGEGGGITAYTEYLASGSFGTCVPTSEPDLIGQVGGAATATMSQVITLYGGVANQGTGDAEYFPNLIQVCDENCATVNQTLEATAADSLATGGWQQVSASYTPSSLNQQYYRVCANLNTGWVNVHTESNYGNNCSGWQLLTVGTPMPDLTAGGVTPATAFQGQTQTLSATVSNIGSSAAGASTGYFQLTAPVSKQSTTASPSVSTIAPNGSVQASFSYTFQTTGVYTVRLCADWNGAVAESNEANNCGPWTDIVVTETPVGSSVSCTVSPSTAVVGGSVTYTAHPVAAATAPYSWTGSDGATGFGSNSTAVRTFSAPGTYGMQVSATNAASPAQCPLVSVGAGWCTAAATDLTITATPARVRAGQSSVITWSASGVNGQNATCAVSGPGVSWTSSVTTSPSCSASGTATTVISTQSIYTLTCNGVSESVTVNVIPNFQEF